MKDASSSRAETPEARPGFDLTFCSFRLDLENERVWRGDTPLELKPKAFALLRYLVEHSQRLISKRELMGVLWGDAHVGDGVIKTHLNQVRRALGDDVRAPRFIETVNRRGYRFIAPVAGAVSTVARQGNPAAPGEQLVGREPELSVLMAALHRSLQGRRELVFLTGEAGIGKTSLANAFVHKLEQRGAALTAHGSCVEHHGAGEAYLPILEAFGRLCRGAQGDLLISVLRRCAPNWLAQLPELLDPRGRQLSAGIITRERLLSEMGAAVSALTRSVCLVLVLEDLHWADYSTLELLEYLARSSDSGRLLIIGTYRPQEVGAPGHPLRGVKQRLEAHEQCRELPVRMLGMPEIQAYLRARFGEHLLPPEVARVIHEHTEGNPLFMVRVVDALVKQGSLVETHSGWSFTGAIDAIRHSVPQSVVALIERDVERLQPLECNILEAASVAGAEFSSLALAAAAGLDPVSVESTCVGWSRQGRFIRVESVEERTGGSVGVRCAFLHALYQQVVYGRIGPARRAELHRRIGLWEEAEGGRAQASAASLARHFQKGADPARALRYRKIAGEQALVRSAYREGIDHFAAALALGDLLPDDVERKQLVLALLLQIASAYVMVHGYAVRDVDQAYARASEISRQLSDSDQTAAAIAGMGTFQFVRAQYGEAEQLGHELLALGIRCRDIGIQLEGHLLAGLAQLYLGKLREAGDCLRRSLALYDPALHAEHHRVYRQDPRVTALAFLAWVTWHSGDSRAAVQQTRRAEDFARERSEPFSLACALSYSMLLHLFNRDPTSTRAAARELLALAQEHGFAFQRSSAALILALVDFDGAAGPGALDPVLRLFASREGGGGTRVGRSYWFAAMADACLRNGALEATARALSSGFEAVHEQNERFWEPELYRIYAGLVALDPSAQDRDFGFARPLDAGQALLIALERARAMGSVALERRVAQELARGARYLIVRGA